MRLIAQASLKAAGRTLTVTCGDGAEGHPSGVPVRIDSGHMGEGGRFDVTLEVKFPHPTEGSADA